MTENTLRAKSVVLLGFHRGGDSDLTPTGFLAAAPIFSLLIGQRQCKALNSNARKAAALSVVVSPLSSCEQRAACGTRPEHAQCMPEHAQCMTGVMNWLTSVPVASERWTAYRLSGYETDLGDPKYNSVHCDLGRRSHCRILFYGRARKAARERTHGCPRT